MCNQNSFDRIKLVMLPSNPAIQPAIVHIHKIDHALWTLVGGGGRACCVHHRAHRILRQSRPSLRRWRASSSGWASLQRRRRPLPRPAAARLKATQAPTHRGQRRAAAAGHTTFRETLEGRRGGCYSRRQLCSISIPADCAGKRRPTQRTHTARGREGGGGSRRSLLGAAIGCASRQSNINDILLAAEAEPRVGDGNSVTQNEMKV